MPGERRSRHRASAAFAAWIFDLDNTLYPAECDLFAQIDRRIGLFIAERFGLDGDAARQLQKRLYREHGTTLRGLMREYAVAPEIFLKFVHAIDVAVVPPSRELDRALAALPGPKYVFTNGSAAHARRVLRRLGVGRHFAAIYDIAAAGYVPKPEPATYRTMVARFGIDPRRAVMVDDIARNLEPAAGLGIATVWLAGERAAADPAKPAYVDHVARDLLAWLRQWLGRGD